MLLSSILKIHPPIILAYLANHNTKKDLNFLTLKILQDKKKAKKSYRFPQNGVTYVRPPLLIPGYIQGSHRTSRGRKAASSVYLTKTVDADVLYSVT